MNIVTTIQSALQRPQTAFERNWQTLTDGERRELLKRYFHRSHIDQLMSERPAVLEMMIANVRSEAGELRGDHEYEQLKNWNGWRGETDRDGM